MKFRKSEFIFFLILLIGIFLRIYKFKETVSLDTDQTAAFLIADRIINHRHVLLVGPFTSLWQVNLLPPTYYYIVTLLYFFLRNEVAVSYVFSLVGIASIPLIYLLGKELFDRKTGLIASLLYAMSFTMVDYSRNIWEPHLVPFFILLSLYLLYFGEKRKNIYIFLIALISFFISLMYVSSFLLLPSFFMLSIVIYKNINQKSHFPFLTVSIYFILFLSIFYLPVFLLESKYNFPSYQYLAKIFSGQSNYVNYNISNALTSVYAHLFLFFRSLFESNNLYLITLFLLFFIVQGVRSIFRRHKSKKVIILLFMLSSAFILTGVYHEKPQVYRLSSLYPIFFLITAYFLKNCLFLPKKIVSLEIIHVVLCFPFILTCIIDNTLALDKNVIARTENIDSYLNPFKIAEYILSSSKGESFTIYTMLLGEKGNHHSISYVYAIEKITGQKYSNLNNYGNWINQIPNRNVKWIYRICKDFNDEQAILNECVNYFQEEKLNVLVEVRPIDNDMIFKFKASTF